MTAETTQMTPMSEETKAQLDKWALAPDGPVALHLRQKLLPVEGEYGVIFPPTYADVGYNIDTLSDGTRVATIDSVGSQANRLEPLFKADPAGASRNPMADLVPQIDIKVGPDLSVSIFDVGHRLGDALVRSTELSTLARDAFAACLKGNMMPLAKLAPTSLVFGAWDSRDTAAKLPRIVQSVIRAWDVQELTRSAQYGPPVDYAALDVFSDEDKVKAEGNTKSPLAQRGFVHVPSGKVPGGVLARGPIYRDITVNLVALRRLNSSEKLNELRCYILGLSLVAATAPFDGFLRQGCLLTLDPSSPNKWVAVNRQGEREAIELDQELAYLYGKAAASLFVVGEKKGGTFGKEKAKLDLQDKKTKTAAGPKGKSKPKDEPSSDGQTNTSES